MKHSIEQNATEPQNHETYFGHHNPFVRTKFIFTHDSLVLAAIFFHGIWCYTWWKLYLESGSSTHLGWSNCTRWRMIMQGLIKKLHMIVSKMLNVQLGVWKKTNTELLDEGLPMQGHAMFVLAGCWMWLMWLMWLWGQKLESLGTKPLNFWGCASLNLPDIWNLLSHLLHFYAYFFETKSVSRVSATSFEFMIHSCWSLPLNGSAVFSRQK